MAVHLQESVWLMLRRVVDLTVLMTFAGLFRIAVLVLRRRKAASSRA